jgi:murein DD-endopeptidase MepM/ murein hydrolase activator NlpD
VGAAGSTGNSSGTHLHFEIRYNGVAQNPWFYLP